jgi:carboxymethylenebutenolidase
MSMPKQYVLTAEEQKLNDLWEKHVRTEFDAHSADNAVGTMVANPLVKLIPVMTGGDGKNEVHQFYAEHFVSQIPADTEIVNVSRTIGQERLVEEMVCRYTHSVEMDWMLPGIAPTGKRVELALLLVVQFDGDKLAHEHAYWDQASVLVAL